MFLFKISPGFNIWGFNICTLSMSSRSTGQTIKRQTENLHVDYYVARDFKSEFKGSSLQQIEKNVEEDYISNVRNNCWKERQTSKWVMGLIPPQTSAMEINQIISFALFVLTLV